MIYAIFQSGGKQYKAALGDIVEVDNLAEKQGGNVTFEKVLLLVSDNEVKVGTPFLADFPIKATIVNHTKGKKIRVSKFKSKVRHRRVTGFRSQLTQVKIDQIGSHKPQETKLVQKEEVQSAKEVSPKPVKKSSRSKKTA